MGKSLQKVISVKIDKSTKLELDEVISHYENITMSEFIRYAIERALRDKSFLEALHEVDL